LSARNSINQQKTQALKATQVLDGKWAAVSKERRSPRAEKRKSASEMGGTPTEMRLMITAPELAADALSNFLASVIRRRYGSSPGHLLEMVPRIARIALECISNSDALYHNFEHTMLVTLVGHDIVCGRALHTHMSSDDYAHLIIACLVHDIGYVRGILKGDDSEGFVVDAAGRKVTLPQGASDAALFSHHVDRSKLYVMERMATMEAVDVQRITRAIEFTRFPYPSDSPPDYEDDDEEGSLLRAADLIGQLADPHYIRKAKALFHELEEAGLNRQLGYTSPADVVNFYPQFYWKRVYPHIQTAIRYLNVTSSGRQWIANLHANVFLAEQENALSGPQRNGPFVQAERARARPERVASGKSRAAPYPQRVSR
jgi:hypothetical protein